MTYHIEPSNIEGSINVPPSKSQSHRALIFGAMAHGSTTITNLLQSPDTERMIHAWKLLGADITQNESSTTIKGLNGTINGATDVIDVGNSGIGLRFLTALGGLSKQPLLITGDSSTCRRPMSEVVKGLKMLGAHAVAMDTVNQFAPIKVQGPIRGGVARIQGQDSQPVSALLIAALFAPGDSELHVENPGEIPWIRLTLDWFDRLSLKYSHSEFKHFHVQGSQRYKGFDYKVPGDWSSAAFPAAAALVTGGAVTLNGIDPSDVQGDRKLFSLFEKMGATVVYDKQNNSLKIEAKRPLQGVEADINDCIDCVTILSVVACYAKGTTKIKNAAVAKEKECNRLACIAQELSKMGARISTTEDGLVIEGGPLQGAELLSHGDHRMAMSLTIAALGAKGKSTLYGTECIAKTYPSYISDMHSLGAKIQ